MTLTNADYQAPAHVDPYSKGLTSIDVFHKATHEGKAFQTNYLTENLADTGIVELLIEVGPDASMHNVIRVYHSASCSIKMFEGASATTGSLIQERNRNRYSSDDSGHAISHTPSISSDGTQIQAYLLPGGDKNRAIGGVSSGFSEFILKSNETYLVRLTNNSGSPANYSITLDWYNQ